MSSAPVRKPMILGPEEGRVYPMGRMRAVFKADREQTEHGYSVSEWWLEPRTGGPGLHAHGEDHVFYIIAGTLSLSIDGEWSHLQTGSYVLIPGGTPHDFQNRSAKASGFIAFTTPGGFEEDMPDIAAALSAEDLTLDVGDDLVG